ncbi:MAG: hypothetical protein A2Y03_06565 [Omnitrophica WOR_2 bacterium GWF2_38_59]|nr:MAG: hypothetical protein A2Y03_06565 [Omnitrophica WOR_2 bacterium GWF2_38_59]OGX50486.1 MAG: hypothetical protein A2243_02010 [Omnitrophica WOR_2 bacterium RIFOXYA2_FULL_38_17]OGX59495.1 MAG: hypothetical protein A2306_09635 [Omnitrophica WOR_2 bacterium RIFOXYB2_FULL_38_16]HBG62038.1 hypothetical protein [Candidatus Omnitrophota bacterium]
MGFDLSRNSIVLSESERDLLKELCVKHGVSTAMLEDLLKVEKEYQLKERRFGIYEKLRQIIEAY